MRIPFPDDVERLNATDFDIMRCLHANGPLWKMEVTRRINARREDGDLLLDLKPSISKQAVAKRVERLHELDELETTIITADAAEVLVDPGRDFIIGYTLSGRGQETFEAAVERIVRDAAAALMTGEETPDDVVGLDAYLALYAEFHPGVDPELDAIIRHLLGS